MGAPTTKKLLAWAKKGDVDALVGLAAEACEDEDEDEDEGEDDMEQAELAYKWLHVAADFGSKKAAAAADDMLEWSSFRYDDGQLVQGLVHLELGEEYLLGKDGLPKDFEKARAHLAYAKKLKVHVSTDAAKGFPALCKRVGKEAAEVFTSFFPEKRSAKKKATAKKKKKAK
jgi:hypothetical protein